MSESVRFQPQEGDLIASRYRVIKNLGEGAMGDVYLCHHVDLGEKQFVVKILKTEIASDETTMQRFRNEVIAAFDVSHENVVRAYEFIKEDDLVAYTMEYINGGDLADKMAEKAQFSFTRLLRYLHQICLGTQALHEKNIIHRDLKPENILLTQDDVVKISDFGISAVGLNSRMTEHGGLVGSANYIAPEYIENSKFDRRSDIYAIGIIAYEMLTGHDPFPGENMYIRMKQRLHVNPYDPRMFRVDCPDILAQIILKALARDPEKRYQDCLEMLVDLEQITDFGGVFTEGKLISKAVGVNSFELNSGKYDFESNKQKDEHKFIKSEVIDLTQKKDFYKGGFKTTAIVRSKSKVPIWYYLLPLLLVVSILLTSWLYFQPSFKQKDFGDYNPEVDQVLTDVLMQNEKRSLPNKFSFTKDKDSMSVEGKAELKNNKLSNLILKVFPVSAGQSTYIKSILVDKILASQTTEGTSSLIANAIIKISHNSNLIEEKSTIKIITSLSKHKNSFKLAFKVPANLNSTSINDSFSALRQGSKFSYYAQGSLDIENHDIQD